jgi:hypothetical protein
VRDDRPYLLGRQQLLEQSQAFLAIGCCLVCFRRLQNSL